ncbi:hypothetical protein BDQ17DRAFT_757922 [Cyathus striatus]|nr:hypothetical protein BDQ17DRAFT_757922 [Cyathus striatus]
MDDQTPIDLPKTALKLTFEGTFGAQLVASMVNASVYGAAMTFVAKYFKYHSNSDTAVVKGLVILLVALATLETMCTSYQTYDNLVYKFGKEDQLNAIPRSAMGKYAGVYLTAFVAQLFYATRIWTLTGHFTKHYRLLTYPVVVLSFIQVLSGAAQVFLMGYAKTFLNLRYITYITVKLIVIQGVSTATCDAAITASFSFIYYNNRSGFNSPTHSLLNKFILYAVNRAAATSFCAIISIFMFYYLSGTYSYMVPLLVNTHLYVISVVSVLTARGSMREENYSLHLSNIHIPSSNGNNTIADINDIPLMDA